MLKRFGGKPDVSRALPILLWLLSCFTRKTMEEEGPPLKHMIFLKTFFWINYFKKNFVFCMIICIAQFLVIIKGHRVIS